MGWFARIIPTTTGKEEPNEVVCSRSHDINNSIMHTTRPLWNSSSVTKWQISRFQYTKPRCVWLEEVMSEVIVISSTQFMVSLQPKLLPNDSARLSRCFFVCHVQPANCRAAKPAGEFVSTARGRKYFQKISKKKKCTKYHESRSSSKWTGKRNAMN